jgi:hypothetical protein
MLMLAHWLRATDARYAIGAAASWPVYGASYLFALRILDNHHAAAAGASWIVSYGVVYVFQKYGTFGVMGREAMLREIGQYAVAVVGLSAAVNFMIVTVLADYDPTLIKIVAVAAAAVPAALVAWFVSTRVLQIGVPC